MYVLKVLTLQFSLLLFTLFLVSACGGGGSSSAITPTSKEKAIEKITAYAQDSGRSAPTLQDYLDAGVTGVSADNLEQLNEMVSGLSASEVDTTAELEELTTQLGGNIKPTVNAGGNKTVQVNHSVTLTGSGTDSDGTIVGYQWEKDNVVLSTEASFAYTPTTIGTDMLTFTVTDNEGNSESESIVVTVSAAPPVANQVPTADAGINKTVQVNNAIRITGSGNDIDGEIHVEWKKGSTSLSNNASFVYTPSHVGTDTLTFIVTDDDGATASDSMTVTVTAAPQPNQAPTANAGLDKTIQVNKTITIVGVGSDVDGSVTFQWKKGSTVLSASASFQYTPTAVGTDTLTFTVIDDDGASNSDSMNVVVTAAPTQNQAPTANAGPDKSVQVNNPITITGSASDTDGTIASYKWEKGATLLSTLASFPYTPTTAGTDTLTLTVTDNEGATATDTMDVVVASAPVADTTPPVITRIGASSITIFQGDSYTDAGATAIDNKDGTITANIITKVNGVIGNTIDTNAAPGTSYTITYNVSDAAGNAAAQVTRIVNIIADTEIPVITRLGSASIDLVQGANYSDAGATAMDNRDGNITANISVTGLPIDVNAAINTEFTISYNVSDAAGNAAMMVTRLVTIVAPTSHVIPPSDAFRDDYLAAINAARSTSRDCGGTTYPAVAAVTWNEKLYKTAYEHSQDMSESDVFSHAGSGTVNDWSGQALSPPAPSHVADRLANYGYAWTSYSENITAGTNRDTVQKAMDSWLASPGHCINIMSPSVEQVGLAHTYNSSAYYRNYWTQNFGRQ